VENIMNQKLRELVCQVTLNNPDYLEDWDNVDLKKFVELFLEESIKVMTKYDYHGEWLGEKLKEHFEVK